MTGNRLVAWHSASLTNKKERRRRQPRQSAPLKCVRQTWPRPHCLCTTACERATTGLLPRKPRLRCRGLQVNRRLDATPTVAAANRGEQETHVDAATGNTYSKKLCHSHPNPSEQRDHPLPLHNRAAQRICTQPRPLVGPCVGMTEVRENNGQSGILCLGHAMQMHGPQVRSSPGAWAYNYIPTNGSGVESQPEGGHE